MYTEATVQSAGDNAKLQLEVPSGNSISCLTFFYHMYGYSMGTLNVFNGNTTIFTASGDQGNYWRKVARTVNSSEVVSMPEFYGQCLQSAEFLLYKQFKAGHECYVYIRAGVPLHRYTLDASIYSYSIRFVQFGIP